MTQACEMSKNWTHSARPTTISFMGDYGYFEFDPRLDVDAAAKLSFNAILLDRRFADLESLLAERIVGIEGDPGWSLVDRRSGEMPDASPDAKFRFDVSAEEFSLGHPRCDLSEEQFRTLLRSGLERFRSQHGESWPTIPETLKQFAFSGV